MSNYPIFSVLGIEIEYMLVDKDSLDVRPLSDKILKTLAGHQTNQVAIGDIALSNELVMHVLEFKNNGPKPPQAPIAEQFQKTILQLQPLLESYNLKLLPTGAHPWMNPEVETVRWPYGSQDIYNQYDKIFNCQGHGWANLQSMHVNLPYSNEEEFAQLHSLIRLILPLIPAFAASSPILDGKYTGFLDARLHFYEHNQKLIPSISGDIIPEFIRSEEEYKQTILNPMYQDISPYDTQNLLQFEWLNSRAAIPKFAQKAIEIRIIDSQECVTADIAMAKVIVEILKYWQSNSPNYLKNPIKTKTLKVLFDKAITQGLSTVVEDTQLLNQWGLPGRAMTFTEVWSFLIETVSNRLDAKDQQALETVLSQGNLSQRILRATGANPDKNRLKQVYNDLAQCLLTNQQYKPS